MSRLIRPHHLLIFTLIAACFTTPHSGPSGGTAIAIRQVERPAASVVAHNPPRQQNVDNPIDSFGASML
jgi:hypothetical protein